MTHAATKNTNTKNDSHRYGVVILIGIGKLLKAAILVCVALATHRLANSSDGAGTLIKWFQELHLEPGNKILQKLLARLGDLSGGKLELVSAGTWFYAALFALEGVGLLLLRRWAEWLTVITTALFIPLEIYELTRHATAARVSILLVNVAIVIYLIFRLRSEEKELHQETGMSIFQRNRHRLLKAFHFTS